MGTEHLTELSLLNLFQVETYITSTLKEEEFQILAKELVGLTSRGFMQEETDELYQDVFNHIRGSDRLVIVRNGGNAIAFICATLKSVNNGGSILYHLEGIIVDNEYQGSGLAFKLLSKELRETNADLLGFHTQNSKMLQLGMKLADLNDRDAKRYATDIGTRNQCGIVDKSRYGESSLYGNMEMFEGIAITSIDWQHGDALICVGPVKQKMA